MIDVSRNDDDHSRPGYERSDLRRCRVMAASGRAYLVAWRCRSLYAHCCLRER